METQQEVTREGRFLCLFGGMEAKVGKRQG